MPARAPDILPGMPTTVELRMHILVPSLGKIALSPPAIVSASPSNEHGESISEKPEFDPDRRRAFGSTPNLIKVPVEESIEVTPADIAHVQPSYVGTALYAKRGKKVVDGIAFNPDEHKVFIYSMGTFLERISDAAELKYAESNDFLKQEHILLSRVDALQTRLTTHDGVLDGYRGQWKLVNELERYAAAPGFALTKEGNLRSLASAVWKGPITNMMRVVANEKSWSAEESKAAQEALLRALLYARPQRAKVQNWQVALFMARKYIEDKGTVVGGRRNSIDLRLKTLNKELSDMYEQSGFTPRR